MKQVFKKLFQYFSKALLLVFIVFLLFLGSLFFREQKVPRFVMEWIACRISTEEIVIDCESASFGFRHGVRLSGVSVYDMLREDGYTNPIVHARNIHYDILRNKVWIYGIEYSRLPDPYYTPGSPTQSSPPAPLDFDIPALDDLEVVLDSPSILGLGPDRVSFRLRAFPASRKIVLDNVEVILPGQENDTVLHGSASMDLVTQKIRSTLHGSATQRQIRPFLEVLDIQCSLPYMDAFTDIPLPVGADLALEVDLYGSEFSLILDLDVRKMGKYNSVPMSYARGGVYFHSKIIDGTRRVALKVPLPAAADTEDRRLSGWLTVDDFLGDYKLNYDVKSGLKLDDALEIADFMDPATLDFVKFKDAPYVTVKGSSGTSAETIAWNDLGGEFTAGEGTLDGLKFAKANGRYSLKEDVLSLNVEMDGVTGGRFKFDSSIFCEKFEEDKARFSLSGTYRNGSLEEIAEALKFDLGVRKGDIDADLEITGSVGSNMWRTVNGRGRVKVDDGHLARMKLFAGLTELLAERVPGVSFLVDQTQASCDFEFDNGVFVSDNVYIEGGLVSIKGWGRYDISKDDLDFTARVQFLKKETIAGKIIHSVTYPVTKLLLEFKVTGPIDNPKWEYIPIFDRIL